MHGHGFTYNGNRLTSQSKSFVRPFVSDADHVDVLPGTMSTLYMNATMPGHWQIVCHINAHVGTGMVGWYTVSQ